MLKSLHKIRHIKKQRNMAKSKKNNKSSTTDTKETEIYALSDFKIIILKKLNKLQRNTDN